MSGQISPLNPAQLTLDRLLPRLELRFANAIATRPDEWHSFRQRLQAYFPRLFQLLKDLYGTQYDFYYHLEELLASLLKSWLERPATLKVLDAERERHPDWFLSNQILGGVCYVDLFAGDLTGIRHSIPYFKELGLTYLHLMPLFRSPVGENDGGYAISSYREVDPRLGTMADLEDPSGRITAERHQPGAGFCLQPHLQ